MLRRVTLAFLLYRSPLIGELFFCTGKAMASKPETLRMWLGMQSGNTPIVLWWEPIDPDETIFRVSTSFGIYIIRNFKGEIIEERDSL